MKWGGRAHKLWFKWTRNAYLSDVLWPWQPICWIYRDHRPGSENFDWNMGRTYCVICGKTISKDPWRVKRDLERKGK